MTKERFLASRRPAWVEFEQILRNKQFRTLQDVHRLARLLREISGDLAVLRTKDWGDGLTNYVNDLVARGHNTLYRQPPNQGRLVWGFLTREFPRTFRRESGYFIVAAALFFCPLAVMWAVVQAHPPRAERIVPAEQLAMYEEMYRAPEPVEEVSGETSDSTQDVWADSTQSDLEAQATMAGFYVQHNVGIALQCFARGFLLGLGTIYTLLYNGIAIGTIAGYMVGMGHDAKFLSFVVSHGSFELTAIAIAGAGGLILGDAFLHPGNRSRGEALKTRSLVAVELAAGAAAMLVIAALIEGFWSPSSLPATVKFLGGGLLWLVVGLYLALAGRSHEV